MEVPTNLMFSDLARELVDEQEPSSGMIKGHLYCVAVADHCIMVLTAFLTLVFSPRKVLIHDLAGSDARMQTGSCKNVQFPLPQHLHYFGRDIKIQDLVERTRFNPALSILTIRRLEELNWAAEGCLG